jgi:hypothetical protein
VRLVLPLSLSSCLRGREREWEGESFLPRIPAAASLLLVAIQSVYIIAYIYIYMHLYKYTQLFIHIYGVPTSLRSSARHESMRGDSVRQSSAAR